MPNSKRVEVFWNRLKQWYGTRIVEAYGEAAPPDWAKLIDFADNNQIKHALEKIRSMCPIHPPTFPQFELAIKNVVAVDTTTKPDVREQLIEYILKQYHQGIMKLTPRQLGSIPPWTFIGREYDALNLAGVMTKNHGVEFVGVVIPADGEHQGYRVMAEDMHF